MTDDRRGAPGAQGPFGPQVSGERTRALGFEPVAIDSAPEPVSMTLIGGRTRGEAGVPVARGASLTEDMADGRRAPSEPDLFALEAQECARHHAAPSFEAKAAIWREFREGVISFAEAQRRSAKIGALQPEQPPSTIASGKGAPRPPLPRPRHSRPAPNASRQYANPMATTALRDDRLTPGARALLVVLRARCGKGRRTEAAKGTLAAIMSRSTRTIRRYLGDLERFGYIVTEIRRTARGFHTGLVIELTEAVMPFFSEPKGLARWLGESALAKPFLPFAASSSTDGAGVFTTMKGMTVLSPKNQLDNDSSYRIQNGREIHRGAGLIGPG